MRLTEAKSAPQDPSVPQLGALIKLSLELRWIIWDYVFDGIQAAPFALAIMRCSRHLYQEIWYHLFDEFEHEFRVSDGLGFNFTIKQRRSQGWELKNTQAVRSSLCNFPWAKVGGKMFVNILPPPQRDPGQIVQIWQKVNQLVNILQTMPSAPSVWVSLLGDWSSGKIPQVSVTYTNGYNGYRPDHDIAIVPFTWLSDWHYLISPSYSATIANERQLTKRSLLFKYGKDSVLEECQWGCVRAPDVNIVHDWLTDTRIFLDRRLDDIPGKTAGALRLERFQTWFQDSWASEYETQFISDLQKHQSTVLKHDRGLLGARRRHKLLIMLHHIYHASQDDPHKVEAALNEMTPRVYEKWDPQFWSACWGDGMPSLSFRLVEGRLDWQYWYRVYWSYRKFTVFGMILRGASSTTVTIRDAEWSAGYC